MRMGALLSPLADATNTGALAAQARAYEGAGFSSLWMVQAIGRGFIFTDPLIALGVAATVTEHVTLGTAVLQVPLYRPMDLAHRVFSLQQICGDRLILASYTTIDEVSVSSHRPTVVLVSGENEIKQVKHTEQAGLRVAP